MDYFSRLLSFLFFFHSLGDLENLEDSLELDFLIFVMIFVMIYFVLPRDGPPQILLGASVVNTWKGYLHPELTGLGVKLQLSYVLEHLIEDFDCFYDV